MDEIENECQTINWANFKKTIDPETRRSIDSADAFSIDGRIFLGSFKAGAKSLIGLKNLGITHIATVGNDMKIPFPKEFQYKLIRIDDHPKENIEKYFDESYEFVKQALDESPSNKILIHCWAGVSRSATITIYTMVKLYNIKLTEAIETVRRQRWWIQPNEGFINQLNERIKKEFPNLSESKDEIKLYFESMSLLNKLHKVDRKISPKQEAKVLESFNRIFGSFHPFTLDVYFEMFSFANL